VQGPPVHSARGRAWPAWARPASSAWARPGCAAARDASASAPWAGPASCAWARRTVGAWRPSPGAVYPALAQLEDEGLVRVAGEAARGRTFRLTEEGEKYVEEHREDLGSPWKEAGEGVPDELVELHNLVGQLGMTTMQVVQSGNESQVAEAKKVLDEARRSLYRILAD
jgi:DNA-binding PadR family transcriptional regulator